MYGMWMRHDLLHVSNGPCRHAHLKQFLAESLSIHRREQGFDLLCQSWPIIQALCVCCEPFILGQSGCIEFFAQSTRNSTMKCPRTLPIARKTSTVEVAYLS